MSGSKNQPGRIQRAVSDLRSAALSVGDRFQIMDIIKSRARKEDALLDSLIQRYRGRLGLDMRRWRSAQISAESVDYPNRRELLELYGEAIKDPHLISVIETRSERLLGLEAHFWDKEGRPQPQLDSLLRQPWFGALVQELLNSRLYGFSLCELVVGYDGTLRLLSADRANVVPEFGLLLMDGNMPVPSRHEAGSALPGVLHIDELPQPIIFARTAGLGLLNSAVPLVVAKRVAMGCWAEFTEIFGMPLRIGKMAARDSKRKEELGQVLREMGSAAWAVIEEGESIEFATDRQTDAYQVYQQLIATCNAEMSKLIIGQTLTTEQGTRGARSLGDVHLSILDDRLRGDARMVEDIINQRVLPLLRKLLPKAGLTEGISFGYDLDDDKLSLKEQWEIDRDIIDRADKLGAQVPRAYITEKYGIPLEERQSGSEVPPQPPFPQTGGRSLPPGAMTSGPNTTPKDAPVAAGGSPFEAILLQLAQRIYDGQQLEVDDALYQQTARELMRGVDEAFADALANPNYTLPDTGMYNALRRNVYMFSAAKTYTQLEEINAALRDSAGRPRPFTAFRDRVLAINTEFNEVFLRTEYDTALASAQMARAWNRAQRDKKTLPYLRYKTVRDERVRESHQQWEGITLPVDHAFWQTHFPPNGWNCRCTVEQLRKARVTPDKELQGLERPPKLFAQNPGLSGVAFPPGHPYFKNSALGKAQQAGLSIPESPLRDEVSRQYFNSKATVNRASEISINGINLTDEQIIRITGAADNSIIAVAQYGKNAIEFSIKNNDVYVSLYRTLVKDGEEWILKNEENFLVQELQKKGIAVRALRRQIEAARELGIKQIRTYAARRDFDPSWPNAVVMNGYITWPKLGFDANIPDGALSLLSEIPALKDARTLQDLMRIPEGVDWWSKNGNTIYVTFDVSPESINSKAFEAYLKKKGIQI